MEICERVLFSPLFSMQVWAWYKVLKCSPDGEEMTAHPVPRLSTLERPHLVLSFSLEAANISACPAPCNGQPTLPSPVVSIVATGCFADFSHPLTNAGSKDYTCNTANLCVGVLSRPQIRLRLVRVGKARRPGIKPRSYRLWLLILPICLLLNIHDFSI